MTPSIDIERVRAETPGTRQVLHFNNAGAALQPRAVLDAVYNHLNLEAEIGGYEAAAQNRDAVEAAYDAVSHMLACSRDEVALVENATRAWDMAFYAIDFQPGDRILTGMNEYAGNYIPLLQVSRRTGAEVVVVPNDASGRMDLNALADFLDERVRLVALTHVPTNGGLVNPAVEVGRLVRDAGCLYLLDACQSVGQMPVHPREIGCHMLSATGRKYLRGPRGTGFLYVCSDLIPKLEPPQLDLHAATWTSADSFVIREDARRFEVWESNFAARIGLGVAVAYGNELGWDAIQARINDLAGYLRNKCAAIPGVRVRDLGPNPCGIVSLSLEGNDPTDVFHRLRNEKINTSVTDVFSTRLDMEDRGLESMLRASVHYYNTPWEVDRFCERLACLTGE